MILSPFATFSHLKETLVQYLETAYKISHADVFAERRALLVSSGAVVKEPLIETTPGFPQARHLREIIAAHPAQLPEELLNLLAFGTPLGKQRLWFQQD